MFGDAHACCASRLHGRGSRGANRDESRPEGKSANGRMSADRARLPRRKGNSASSTRDRRVDSDREQMAAALFAGWSERTAGRAPFRKTPIYDARFRDSVLTLLEQPPPSGLGQWDGRAVAETLGASVHAVWRLLRKEGIYLQRLRTWCVSTDPEFAPKAAEVVGLYLNPPLNALALRVDERPRIQIHGRTGIQ